MTTASLACLVILAAAPFQQYALTTDLNVCDVASRDINGDGHADIVALCAESRPEPKKRVCVFAASPEGAYSPEPTFSFNLAPEFSAVFFSKPGGNAPVELVAMCATGAAAYRYKDGQFVQTERMAFYSLLPVSAKEPLFMPEIAQDLDGDGADEWLLPVPGGHEIRRGNEVLAQVRSDIASEISRDNNVTIWNRLPAVSIFSTPGTKTKSVGLLSDEYADFAFGDRWERRTRFRIPLALEEKWTGRGQLEDINGDGLPDLVISQMKGSLNVKATTYIYFASAPYTYPERPTALFSADGSMAVPALLDVDGDGKKDIVMTSVPLGVGNIVNYLTRRKVTVHADVYLCHADGFAHEPEYSQRFVLDAPEGRDRVAYTSGDFNGDGRMDAVYGEGANKMGVHLGSPERFLAPRAWAALDLSSFGVAKACKLKGGKSDGLLLFHPTDAQSAMKRRIDVVIF